MSTETHTGAGGLAERLRALAEKWEREAASPDGYSLLVQTYKAHARELTAILDAEQGEADEHGRALALLSAVEMIKQTGGAVEIAGVRIEPCDEYGRTETMRRPDALAAPSVSPGEPVCEACGCELKVDGNCPWCADNGQPPAQEGQPEGSEPCNCNPPAHTEADHAPAPVPTDATTIVMHNGGHNSGDKDEQDAVSLIALDIARAILAAGYVSPEAHAAAVETLRDQIEVLTKKVGLHAAESAKWRAWRDQDARRLKEARESKDAAVREAVQAHGERIRQHVMIEAPRLNAEMRPDGTVDAEMAAYVEGWRSALSAFNDAVRREAVGE